MDGDRFCPLKMDNFVKTLIEEVKSQGVFDEFRFNCCLADVDTKPAYQNVRNRVENAVNDFLSKQHWTPETNKVQLRERLRKHLLDSDVLDKGVDHIVDQVVNPKVATIFEPKIESIVYKYLGITPPPPPTNPPPRPPLLPAPPLPPYTPHGLGHMNGGNLLKVETTASLLPTDLEQISPDSDRATVKSDAKEDSKDDELPPGVDGDDLLDDDDTSSPAFEPSSSIKEDINNGSFNASDSVKKFKEIPSDSRDAGASQASQLSQVSSDSRLTIASTDAPQTTSANDSLELTSNIAANISEEAQMPKFNENSTDAHDSSGRQLHFDIKQDPITFEGTERRNSMTRCTEGTSGVSIEDAIMSEVKANINDSDHPLEASTMPKQSPDPTKSERSMESNFDQFTESTPHSEPVSSSNNAAPHLPPIPDIPERSEIKPDPPVIEQTKTDLPPEYAAATMLPIVFDELNKGAELTASPTSASSSSKKSSHSKDKERRPHSYSRCDDKDRRKSRDHERDKSRSKTSSSKHSSSHSSHSSSSKHRSSSSKYEKNSSTNSSKRSIHDSSTSKRSSTHRHGSSSSHKKHKSSSTASRTGRDRPKSRESHSHSHRSNNGSGNSSSNSKRERDRDRNKSSSNSTSNSAAVIPDDHNEIKAKLQKRGSNDSNDDPPGNYGKSNADSADTQSEEKITDTQAENTGTSSENNETNGTNGTDHSDAVDLVAANNVVIVSDMLQQSSFSFVELNASVLPQSPTKVCESDVQPTDNQIESSDTVPKSLTPEPIVEPEIKVTPEKEDVSIVDNNNVKDERLESKKAEVCAEAEDTQATAPVEEKAGNESTGLTETVSPHPEAQGSAVVGGDSITHLEEGDEQFALRLQLIEQHIKDRRQLMDDLNEHGDTSCLRRRLSKRRFSDSSSTKERNSSSGSSSSSDSSTAKPKRRRLDEAKTSPTPSEISANSKENEELEKPVKVVLSASRLSQKLCQQQRYTNDDLYKPRPLLSQRSRRRGLDSIN